MIKMIKKEDFGKINLECEYCGQERDVEFTFSQKWICYECYDKRNKERQNLKK